MLDAEVSEEKSESWMLVFESKSWGKVTMIVDKRIWFVTWVHGHYSGEFKTLTENGKHGSWHAVFPPPGIEETDIFGWHSLLWQPTVHPATEFNEYFALNLLKMGYLYGFFSCFTQVNRWMNEYIIAHPPFLALKIPGFFPLSRWTTCTKMTRSFLASWRENRTAIFIGKDAVEPWNYTWYSTLKKLDLLFKLQVTIELFQFLNRVYYHSCFFFYLNRVKFWMDTFDMNQPWFKHRRPKHVHESLLVPRLHPPRVSATNWKDTGWWKSVLRRPIAIVVHNYLHPFITVFVASEIWPNH